MSNYCSRDSSLAPSATSSTSFCDFGTSIASPFTRGPPSRPLSRAPSPSRSTEEEEWRRARSRASSRAKTPIPSYTDALCAVSRRLRHRSIPPPTPPPSVSDMYSRSGSGSRVMGKPPPGPQSPRVVASDYYKKYVKSIYEREPLFQDFCQKLPVQDANLYNRDSLEKIKRDFHDMVDDNWTRKGCSDPSVDHDLGSKLYPWKSLVVRDAEPASERLARIHASRPRDPSPSYLPRLTVYHRSTWRR